MTAFEIDLLRMAFDTAREQHLAHANRLCASLVTCCPQHGTEREKAINLWSSYVTRGAKPIAVATVISH